MQTLQKLSKVSPPIPQVIKQNNTKTLTKLDQDYKYDRTWLNKELAAQIEIITETKNICTQAQLYQYLDYSKDKFRYWMDKNGSSVSTQDLIKKRDELLEARLLDKGFSGNNPAFVIFLLKNFYNYQDKREIATDNTYTFNVTRGLPTAHQQRKLVKATQQQKH